MTLTPEKTGELIRRSRKLQLRQLFPSPSDSETMAIPNGTAAGAPTTVTKLPKVIGISFGNSYASIAVISEVSVLQTGRAVFLDQTRKD